MSDTERFSTASEKAQAAHIRCLFEYNQMNGHFIRLVRTSNKTAIGIRAGTLHPALGYRLISIDGVQYFEHRLAWLYMTGHWPKEQIDHRNGVRNDNCWPNLREATRSENRRNTDVSPRSKSGIKGVRRTASGKWLARINVGGQKRGGAEIYLGTFATVQMAQSAYSAAAKQYFGGFARTGTEQERIIAQEQVDEERAQNGQYGAGA